MWLRSTVTVAALGIGLSSAAWAGHNRSTDYVYARVVGVQPIVRYVAVDRPRQECWEELAYPHTGHVNVAGQTLAGGVIGGAIGRQLGHGHNRGVMTLIGAFVGSAVAHERAERVSAADAQAYGRAVPVERCQIVHDRITEERVEGYRVTYRYRGARHTIRTHEPPGERIRLRVSAVPVRY